MLLGKASVSFPLMFVGLMDSALVNQEEILLVPVRGVLLEPTVMKVSKTPSKKNLDFMA